MRRAAKSSSRSGISGWARKVSTTSSSLFLLHSASSMPSRRRAGHELLQRAARRIERHALRPVLAADAGPQGVVAIERDHFVRRRGHGVDLAGDGGGQGHEVKRGVGQVAQFVGVRVVDLGHGIERLHLGRREGVDGGQTGQRRREMRTRAPPGKARVPEWRDR